MAFSARAMRFVTISPTMRKLAGALFQTVVPILTVLGFCKHAALTARHAARTAFMPFHRRCGVLWDTTLIWVHRWRCLLSDSAA